MVNQWSLPPKTEQLFHLPCRDAQKILQTWNFTVFKQSICHLFQVIFCKAICMNAMREYFYGLSQPLPPLSSTGTGSSSNRREKKMILMEVPQRKTAVGILGACSWLCYIRSPPTPGWARDSCVPHVVYGCSSSVPRLSVPECDSQLWRKKLRRKAWEDFSRHSDRLTLYLL